MTRLVLPLALLTACGPVEPEATHDGAPGLYDVPQNPVELTALGSIVVPDDGVDEERTYMLASEGQLGLVVVTDDERLEYRLLDGTVVPGPSIEGFDQSVWSVSSVDDAGLFLVDFGEGDARAWRVSADGFEPVDAWPRDQMPKFGSVVGDAAYMDHGVLSRIDLHTGEVRDIRPPEGVLLGVLTGGHGRFLSTDREVFHVLDLDTESWSTHLLPDGLVGGWSAFDGPDHVVMALTDPETHEKVLARLALDGSHPQVSTERLDHSLAVFHLDEGPVVAWFDRSDPDQTTLVVERATFR